jgi:hypothetical protein
MPDQLLDLAHGDPRLAEALRRMLTELAQHGTEKLREMSRAVLDGASLRALALSDTYGEEIGDAFGRFWTSYQDMSAEQRAELEEQTERRLDGFTVGPI